MSFVTRFFGGAPLAGVTGYPNAAQDWQEFFVDPVKVALRAPSSQKACYERIGQIWLDVQKEFIKNGYQPGEGSTGAS